MSGYGHNSIYSHVQYNFASNVESDHLGFKCLQLLSRSPEEALLNIRFLMCIKQ